MAKAAPPIPPPRPPGGRPGQEGHDPVEQITGTTAVERGDRHGLAQPQLEELGGIGLLPVRIDLVGHQEDGGPGPAETPGQGHVLLLLAGLGVHHQQDDVGVLRGAPRLARHEGVDAPGLGGEPAGVDQAEPPAAPLGLELDAVAGHPRALVRDGLPPPEQPVRQGRLPDVLPAHHGHRGQPPRWAPQSFGVGAAATHRWPPAAHGRWPRPREGPRRAPFPSCPGNGVRGRDERVHQLVSGVPGGQGLGHVGGHRRAVRGDRQAALRGGPVPLPNPPRRPLRRRRHQEDLDGGVGEHHGADVPALHHGALAAQPPLLVPQHVPNLGMT